MKYPYLKTLFEPNLDKDTICIIKRYWEMNNETFTISPTSLRTELNITQPKLNSIVKENSQTTLFLEECVACEKPIEIKVTCQSTAAKKIENINFHCVECQDNLKQVSYKDAQISIKLPSMKYALEVRLWTKLKKEELAVLKKIIEVSDYKTLRNTFIQQNPQYYWPIINKLDRLLLIDIQKVSYYSNVIKRVYYLPELAKDLRD